MSDTATSGDTVPVAPAATASATPAPAQPAASEQAAAATPASTFGTSRGSGLARGKRATHTATSAGDTKSGEYQPTAIQVVTTAREYKNPFAPDEPATPEPETAQEPAPAVPTPAPAPTEPAPAQTEPAVASTEPVIATQTAKSASEEPAPAPETPEPKAELNILPPEEKQSRAQSWQSDSFAPEQKDRPVFQPRGERGNRGERGDRERGHRRDRREGGGADATPEARQPAPAPAPEKKKSTGFIGWLKGLFGGADDEQGKTTAQPEGDRNNRRNRDGGRRHRGGRNRQRGENRDGQGGGDHYRHGNSERRFDRGDRGNRDRGRNRGGRNRHRGENRDSQGGGGSSESAQ